LSPSKYSPLLCLLRGDFWWREEDEEVVLLVSILAALLLFDRWRGDLVRFFFFEGDVCVGNGRFLSV